MAVRGLDVNKSKEWNLGDFKKYFTTSKRLFGNSEEFSKIGRLAEELFEFENQDISKEMAEARTKKMRELMAATQDYITKRANPRTSTGKERLKIANDLLGFCQTDIEYTTFDPSIEYFSGKKMEDARKGVSYDDVKKLDKEKENVAESFVMSEEAVKDYANKTKKASLAAKICMKFNKLLGSQDKDELKVMEADYDSELSALNDPNVVKGMRYLYSEDIKQLSQNGFLDPAKAMIQNGTELSKERVSQIRENKINEARKKAWGFSNSVTVEKARKMGASVITIDEELMKKASSSVKGFREIKEESERVKKISFDEFRKQEEQRKIEESEREYEDYKATLLEKEKAYKLAMEMKDEKEKDYVNIKDSDAFPSDKENAKNAYEKAEAELKEMGYQLKKARADFQAAGLRTGHDKREEEKKRNQKEQEKKESERKAFEKNKPEVKSPKTFKAGKK